MKAYLLGFVAAAFLVSLLNALGGKGAGEGMRKLVGVFLLILAVFRPLGSLELTLPELDGFRQDAKAAVTEGTEQAQQAYTQRITDGYCAYILTNAEGLGLSAQVQVRVGEKGYPESVILFAAASPADRQNLTGCIARELGIEKEAVVWIDPYQSSE